MVAMTKNPGFRPRILPAVIAEEIEQPFNSPKDPLEKIRYIASDEVSPNEVAKILGEAIGQPGLKWIVIPDEQQLKNMIAAGMNPQIAKGLVEMNAGRRSGVLSEDYNRNKPALGKVKLNRFCKGICSRI